MKVKMKFHLEPKYNIGDELYFVQDVLNNYNKFGINKGKVKVIYIKEILDQEFVFYEIETIDDDYKINRFSRLESECTDNIEDLKEYLQILKNKKLDK